MIRRAPLLALMLAVTSCVGWSYAVPSPCQPGTKVDSRLPLIEFPCRTDTPMMAMVLTGDGGWRKIDHKVSDVFLGHGIPVLGFLSDEYFRTPRTAEATASDIAFALRTWLGRWKKSEVLLVGYSRGADAIPFVLHRLPPDLASRIKVAAMLGPAPATDFHYTPWSLFGKKNHDAQYPLLPEIAGDSRFRMLCVYGDREKESLCPLIPPGQATVVRVAGGHHFAGGYRELGERILAMAR